jgi:hypothetical protein
MKNFLFNQDYPAQSRASGLILSISSEKEGEQSKKQFPKLSLGDMLLQPHIF